MVVHSAFVDSHPSGAIGSRTAGTGMCSPVQPGSSNHLWLRYIYMVVSVPQWGQIAMTGPGRTGLGPGLPLLTSRLSSLDDWRQRQLRPP